jgi:AcrR family transcriptional regulator
MPKQDLRAGAAPITPRERALSACVDAALKLGGRTLSIHDYARVTRISARMLIHHFGSKAGLDRAIIRAVEEGLRAQAGNLAQVLGGLQAVDELVRGFRSPQSAQVRRLFRALLAQAFEADRSAIAALLQERERWTSLFESALKSKADASRTVTLLLGAAMDAILDDMSSEQASSKPTRLRRRRSGRSRSLDSGLRARRAQ